MSFGNQPHDNGKQYDNTNRGILFGNDRKRGDKDPDCKGSLNVDGRDYWISGWWKQTKKGKALSLSIKPKDEQRRDQYEQSRDAQAPSGFGNEPSHGDW